MSFDNIIKEKRLPALFVGSGFSKRYLKEMPTWNEMMLKIASKVGLSDAQYYAYSNEISGNEMKMPKLATKLNQIITDKVKNGEYDIKKDLSDSMLKEMRKGVPFIKLLIVEELNQIEIKDDKKTKLEIKSLCDSIDKINNIITTNYDLFFENNLFKNNDMTVYVKQDDLYLSPSFGLSEMYKIHGSINNPESMIVVEEDYEKYFENMNIFVSKLYSVLLERPIIFLGYSIKDSNIQKILEGFIKHFPDEKVNRIKENLIFVEWEPGEDELKEGEVVFQVGIKQIRMTKISTDRYDKIFDKIKTIKECISVREIKKINGLIYDVIAKNEKKGERLIFVRDPYDINKIDSNEIVVAIVPKYDSLPNLGLVGVDTVVFIENALYKNENISFDKIAKDWVEKKLSKTHIFPIYYVKKNIDSNLELGKKFKSNEEEMIKTYKKYKNKALSLNKEKIEEYKKIFDNEYKKPTKDLKDSSFTNAIYLYLIDEIEENKFRDYLKKHYEKNKEYMKKCTNFKRAITYLDAKSEIK